MLILKSVRYSSVGRATGRLEIHTSRSRFESQYGWSSCLHSILFYICCHNQSLKPLDQIRGRNFQQLEWFNSWCQKSQLVDIQEGYQVRLSYLPVHLSPFTPGPFALIGVCPNYHLP